MATASARERNCQADVVSSRLNPEYKKFEVIKYQYDYGRQKYIKHPLYSNAPVIEYLRAG